MFRPAVSYALTFLILLSQVGLPLHFHYCKGMLESVSLIFKKACDDHEEPQANLPACCQKMESRHCAETDDKCCHDQVKVLTQDITSIAPQLLQWDAITVDFVPPVVPAATVVLKVNSPTGPVSPGSDSGPPIYILHQALIFYA
jgi:hypothetical protein